MKKYVVLALLLAAAGLGAEAQGRLGVKEKQSVYIGAKGGASLQRMLFWKNEPMSRLGQDTLLKWTAGVFADIPLGSFASLAPELSYVQRGCGMHYQHFSGSNVHYALNVSYMDLRLPIEIRWPIQPWIQPFLRLGAEAGVRLAGQIQMERTAPAAFNQTIDVGNANTSLIDAGVFGGFGIRSVFGVGSRQLMLKFCASYHQGLTDTYSSKEHNGSAVSQNVNAYQLAGKRFSQGVELAFGVAVSLDKEDDACATFAGDRHRRRSSGRRLFGF